MKTVATTTLSNFFINHLNRVYCAKAHLVERLPEIADQPAFADLRYAINETLEDVEKQVERIEQIFELMDAQTSLENCEDMINYMEQAFTGIDFEKGDRPLRDMAILYYLQNMESLEMASFEVLQLVAQNLNNHRVQQLIHENYEEAKTDRLLLKVITQKYLDCSV